MNRLLSMLLCCASVATAQTVNMPRLADGKIDIAAVLSSFEAQRPIGTGMERNQFNGKILGVTFNATYTQTIPPDSFFLTIGASGFSDETAYLVAILLTDLICLDQNRGLAPVERDTLARVETGWQVRSACTTSPRLPMSNDSLGP